MDTPAALPPETIRLLEQGIESSEVTKQYCEESLNIPLADISEFRMATDTIVTSLQAFGERLNAIFADPTFLRMHRSNQYELFALMRKLSCFPDKAEQTFSNFEWGGPSAMSALHEELCTTRSAMRLSTTLLQETRWGHQCPPRPAAHPLPKRPSKACTHFRYMIERDKSQVLAIDRKNYSSMLTEEELDNNRKAGTCIGIVADDLDKDRILGFMLYELHKQLIHLVRFAVDPGPQEQEISSQMMNNLIRKLYDQRRSRILLLLKEKNFFLKAHFYLDREFNDVAHIPDSDDDRYLLEYLVASPATAQITNEKRPWLLRPYNPADFTDRPEQTAFNVTKWDPNDIQPWTPDQLQDHDPFGLWGDEEDA